MASVPTTQQQTDSFIAKFESLLNQEVPPNDKSFIKALSVALSMGYTGVYKYALDRVAQTYAITATGDDLDEIGSEYGVTRKQATQAVIDLTAVGTVGASLYVGTEYVSELNNLIYTTDSTEVVPATNLVPDGDMEAVGFVDWIVNEWGPSGVTKSTAEKYTGVQSTKMDISGGSARMTTATDVMEFGKSYRVSGAIKGEATGLPPRIWATNSAGSFIDLIWENLPYYTAWQTFSVTYTPSTTEALRIRTSNNTTTNVYYDDLSVQLLSVETEATCETAGTQGNISAGAELSTVETVSGFASSAEVLSLITVGTETETDDEYRERILSEIRTAGGGSNNADHRRWALDISGVVNAYPFSEKPENTVISDTMTFTAPNVISDSTYDIRLGRNPGDLVKIDNSFTVSNDGVFVIASFHASSFEMYVSAAIVTKPDNSDTVMSVISSPGDRVVYCEVSSTIDPDGIPTSEILAAIRQSINIDPKTGETRPCLGTSDGSLYVEPIVRSAMYVEVTGLVIDPVDEDAAKDAISTALSDYFLSVEPYVLGIDVVSDKNETVSLISVSSIVQSVLQSYGAYATGIDFGTSVSYGHTDYTVARNEKLKLGGVEYV